MKSKHRLRGLALLLPIVLSGCATSALWDGDRFARYHDPARPTQLSVFQSVEKHDFLVQYDELRDDNDSVRRRAYWLFANNEPVRNPHKPHYVSPKQAAGLMALPIYERTADTNQPFPAAYVVMATNHQDFTLYSDGQNLGAYELPVYADPSGRTKQVLLTPLAVTADLTLIGGFIFLQAWATGGLNCWP